METEEKIKLKELHKGDLKTIWKIYQKDDSYYRNLYFLLSIISAILISVLVYFSDKTSLEIISYTTPIMTSIIPNLLGFNLGAYVLIVGFGSTEILKVLSSPISDENDFSIYQRLISIMSISVITQILTLIFSIIISYTIKLEIEPILASKYLVLFNSLTLFTILFLLIYSILNMVNIVKHVFLFAQTIHFIIRVK